ncbi:hypothetical protein C8J57DRAFT_1707045 [Mycena rebaudengoi]|nr:hypothetical protein C8J57DRAFT_1707045 [Mycena rebaudengoi]
MPPIASTYSTTSDLLPSFPTVYALIAFIGAIVVLFSLRFSYFVIVDTIAARRAKAAVIKARVVVTTDMISAPTPLVEKKTAFELAVAQGLILDLESQKSLKTSNPEPTSPPNSAPIVIPAVVTSSPSNNITTIIIPGFTAAHTHTTTEQAPRLVSTSHSTTFTPISPPTAASASLPTRIVSPPTHKSLIQTKRTHKRTSKASLVLINSDDKENSSPGPGCYSKRWRDSLARSDSNTTVGKDERRESRVLGVLGDLAV